MGAWRGGRIVLSGKSFMWDCSGKDGTCCKDAVDEVYMMTRDSSVEICPDCYKECSEKQLYEKVSSILMRGSTFLSRMHLCSVLQNVCAGGRCGAMDNVRLSSTGEWRHNWLCRR